MPNIFGQKLREYRTNKDMSQEQLAAILGTTKQVISRYENSQRSPKITVVAEYAKTLGVPLSYFLGEPKPQADPLDEQFLSLFNSLGDREKSLALAMLETLVRNKGNG